MSEQPPVLPGSMLVPVIFSPVISGVIRTTSTVDAEERLWEVDDAERLRGHLSRGLLARTPCGPNAFREAALLDAAHGVLVLPARAPGTDGSMSAVVKSAEVVYDV